MTTEQVLTKMHDEILEVSSLVWVNENDVKDLNILLAYIDGISTMTEHVICMLEKENG